MKRFAGMLVGGVVALLAFKLLATLIFPLIGLVFGLVGMAIKLLLIGMVAYFVYTLFRNRKRERHV